ncbi:MAG: histidine phosphatase family protein [Pseudomonadota bacterium]
MIFLRHPTPDIPRGTCYGRLDIGLGPAATNETMRALNLLPGASRVFTSPARRCQPIAREIAQRFNAPLRTDPRLHELNFGTWEGQPWSAIDRRESDPWSEDPWHVAPPGGETFAALHRRVQEAISEAGDDTVFVTHAGPIRAARMILTGAGFSDVFAEQIPYAIPLHFTRKVA